MLRYLGVAVLLVAPITQSAWFYALSIPVLLLMWLSSAGMRRLYRKNLEGLYELRSDSTDGEASHETLSGVTVITAGRNEEAGVERAVRSLCNLDYPDVKIIVVNDHSIDRTPEILKRLAVEYPALTVVHDPPHQQGWLGKANAVWNAVHLADARHKWLVFADADVVFAPKVLRRAVSHAQKAGLDFLTCIPFIENNTLAEELALPVGWRGVVVGARPEKLNLPSSCPVGIGAFILVKRSVYVETGGHSVFYDQQPEDTLLAALVKEAGGKLGVAWTQDQVRVRIYRGYREVRDILVRKFRVNSDDNLGYMVVMASYWIIQYILPLPLAITGCVVQFQTARFSWLATLYAILAFAVYVDTARDLKAARKTCQMRVFVPWLAPLTGLLRFWIEVRAIIQSLFHTKMTWRGREFANIRVKP